MPNPFADFRPGQEQARARGVLTRNLARQAVGSRLKEGYLALVRAEARHLLWPVEHQRVLEAYTEACRLVSRLAVDQEDLEEFLAEMDHGRSLPYLVAGPAGLYLAALVNLCRETHLVLRLGGHSRVFHFLGYALPAGRELILEGDAGDFCGAALAGGRLEVRGNVGDWAGAGMQAGTLLIRGGAGRGLGQWMQGGVIEVGGEMASLGGERAGGTVRQGGQDLTTPAAAVVD
ncbi:MAG: hypothetical protein KQJ78_12765 [Deltaproteobacteria bacterium]|nr:hypothetical protein [Deltaproteobacteria bacterium]